jgi:hypothetical protein
MIKEVLMIRRSCDIKYRFIHMSLALCLVMATGSGCASTTHRTTTTETVKDSDNNSEVAQPLVNQTSSTSTTSSTTTTKEPEHRGVIGSVFHAIGAVLAFPFILIGNVIQAIF